MDSFDQDQPEEAPVDEEAVEEQQDVVEDDTALPEEVFNILEEPAIDVGFSHTFRAKLERSLLLIKPEAVQYKFKILARLKKEGFFVLKERHVLLTPEQASEFFAENYGTGWFPRQVALTSRAPILAVCVTKPDCINELNRLVGPNDVAYARRTFPASLRAKFGNIKDNLKDAVQASANEEKAEFEIHFFFPNMVLEPLWIGEKAYDYFRERIRTELLYSLAEVCKVKPVDPVLWLARYLLVNNKAQPRQVERIATLKT